MFKLFIYVLIIVFISACGVDTASSSKDAGTTDVVIDDDNSNGSDNDNDLDLIDPNPIDNSGDVDLIDPNPINNDGTDDNTTVPDNNTTVPDNNETVIDPVDQADSIFDVTGAVEDEFACIKLYEDGYTNNVISDDAVDYLGETDLEDGVGINSRYAYNFDASKTEVKLFYYDLKPSRDMFMETINLDKYNVFIDTAWAQNDETVFYVKTPIDKDGLYGCYRLDAETIDVDGEVTVTKVYRVK